MTVPVKPLVFNQSQILAEQAAIERLLNAYLRETGANGLILKEGAQAFSSIPWDLYVQLQAQGVLMELRLPATARVLLGAMSYRSLLGHHQFGSSFWTRSNSDTSYCPIGDALELASLLIAELAFLIPDSIIRKRLQGGFLQHIENSIEKTILYVEQRIKRGRPRLELEAEDCFLAAEQSLVYGHPFHPTPKSSEGFSAMDLARYMPELGACFALHYFAVAPKLIKEDFLPGAKAKVIPHRVQSEAQRWLKPSQQDWLLLPCHPWQAKYLCQRSEITALLEREEFLFLGPLGKRVYPTSSVRTVWDPDHDYFFKLPLSVRITNFIRTNSQEQRQRSIDASRVLATFQQTELLTNFTVLLEVGYRTLLLPEATAEGDNSIAACSGVLFREVPRGDFPPMVVAALLEPSPQRDGPPLIQALRQAAIGQGIHLNLSFMARWLRRYLEISLLPLLKLFIHYGVSLEAHVQNSMIALKSGWPVRFYVRDLEGTSISREQAAAHKWYASQLEENSLALYSEQEAWKRLKYYFFINHLGHLIFTLAYYGGEEERNLWQVLRAVLEENSALFSAVNREAYLEELLEQPQWPAKANFISRFQERGENPLYVPIFNPLRAKRVE
jgi:siderophore synthetase component